MDLILFDLDQTLIDSSPIDKFRQKGDWSKAEENFSLTLVYDGVRKMIEDLQEGHVLGVVTSSPRMYATKILAFHNLDIPVLAAYHDTKRHKPDPAPIHFALEHFQKPYNRCILVGDVADDIRAGNAASVDICFFVNWGKDKNSLLDPDLHAHTLESPSDITAYLYGETSMKALPLIDFDLTSEIFLSVAMSSYFKKGSMYDDVVSVSLREGFKKNDTAAIKFWSECAAVSLKKYISGNDVEISCVVRVLGSDEINAVENSPLDILGKKISTALQADYLPSALYKTHKTKPLKQTHLRSERVEELTGVFQVTDGAIKNGANILLIDDICTSGTTAKLITREILKTCPESQVYLFVLGKTSNPSFGTPAQNSKDLLALGAERGIWSIDAIVSPDDDDLLENFNCAIGIDLGTTNSLLAYQKLESEISSIDFLPVEQPTVTGRLVTNVLCPSVVYYHRKSNKTFVGKGAEDRKYDAISERTVFYSSKSQLGQRVLYHNSLDPDIRYPYQVSSRVIEYLLKSFTEKSGIPLDECKVVVTVPASFGGSQRVDTLKAISEAGIDVEEGDLIDEPNAAFIGYIHQFSQHKIPDGSKILIFDMGGGTTDISIVELLSSNHGEYDVRNLAISRYDLIGGDDIDYHLATTLLLPKLYKENKIDESEWSYSEREKLVMSKLRKIARALKEDIASKLLWHIQQVQGFNLNTIPWDQLPDKEEISASIPDKEMLVKGKSYHLTELKLTLESFEEYLEPFVDPRGNLNARKDEYNIISLYTLLTSLEQVSEIPPESIDYLLFVGGSTLNPLIVDAVHKNYPNSEVLSYSDPDVIDRIVAYGATVFAVQKAKREPIPIIPIVPDKIGVLAKGSELIEIIPSGVQVPFPIGDDDFRYSDSLSLPDAGSQYVQIPICVGTANRIYQTVQIPRSEISGEVSIGFRVTDGKTLQCKILHDGKPIQFELNNPVTVYSSDDIRINNLHDALSRYQNAVMKKSVDRDQRTLQVARAFSKLGREPQAVEYAKSLVRDDVDSGIKANALFTLAYSSLGGDAINYYKQYLELRPQSGAVNFNLGNAYEQTGEFNKAEEMWSKAIEGDYALGVTYAALAALREKRGGEYTDLAKDAITKLTSAIKRGDQDDSDYYWLLACYKMLGDDKSVKEWTQKRKDYFEKKYKTYDDDTLLTAGLMGIDKL